MPFNGSGSFSIVNSFVANTTILSAAVNQNFTDIATGLSDCLTRDGQAGMTAVFKAVSGAIGAPGISFNSDATAGLYLSTTGIIGLVAKSLGLLVNSSVYQAASAVIAAGGSGYAVGDTITATGGTAITQPVFTVATLSGSAVATLTVTYPGNYTVTPSNPVSQGSTSGAGTGCTLTVTYTTQYTRSVVTNEAGALPWQRLGSSSFMSALMNSANGLALATSIGSANIAAVVGSTFIIPPGGVLSPSLSVTQPIANIDYLAGASVLWTPLVGNNCPIYNGANMVQWTSAQLGLALTAGAQASGGIYDIYMFLNGGVPTLGFSPSWSAGTSGSVTAGSCARGTGTGGTAFTLINGIKVNAVAMTVNNGASTFSVPINQGTLLGSVYVNATAGQYNVEVTYGQSRVWGLWNAYNRFPITLLMGDGTASWTYSSTTIRQSNAAAGNTLTTFCGLAEESVDITTVQAGQVDNLTTLMKSGIGVNSTTAFSGKNGNFRSGVGGGATAVGELLGHHVLVPSLGINNINFLEASSATVTNTFLGTNASMLMTARWQG